MAEIKPYFEQIRTEYDEIPLEILEKIAHDTLDLLMDERGGDEEVYEGLYFFLALQALIYEGKKLSARDTIERGVFKEAADRYTAFFRNPEVTSQLIFTYCDDQFHQALYDDNDFLKQRWAEISLAFERLVKGNRG